MQQKLHSKSKQNFYILVVHLLTSCKRSHGEVAIVTSAVRSSMTLQRLADLIAHDVVGESSR